MGVAVAVRGGLFHGSCYVTDITHAAVEAHSLQENEAEMGPQDGDRVGKMRGEISL